MAENPDAVAVGSRIRAARQRRRMTLRVLSERTGLSESFLSQMERGLTAASIASMRRIAEALGLMIGDLFDASDGHSPRALRRADRPKIVFGDGATKYLLTSRKQAGNIEVLQANIDVGGSTGTNAYAHGDSEELVIVLSGSAKLELGDDFFELEAGDSLFYQSSTSHRVLNGGPTPCELIWVISPPSY